MLKVNNRNFRKTFLTLTLAGFSLFGISNVDAARVEFEPCSTSTYGIDLDKVEPYAVKKSVSNPDEANYFTSFISNGYVVYCTEKGVPSLNFDSSNEPEWSNPKDADIDGSILQRVLAYGHQSKATSNSCSVEMAGTQLLVWFASKEEADGTKEWRELTEAQLKAMITGSQADKIAKYAYDLKQTVLNHKKYPSFTKTSKNDALADTNRLTLLYNPSTYKYSATYTDTHSILSTWTLGTIPNKISADISGNKLTITSTDDSVKDPISMSKRFRIGCKYYERNNSDPTLQDTSYIVDCDYDDFPAYAGYKYEEIGKGKIKLVKKDSYTGKVLSGVKFGLYSDSSCSSVATDYLGNKVSAKTTDKDGVVSWDNLYYPLTNGVTTKYYVKELASLDGYLSDIQGCSPVTLKSSSEVDKNITIEKTIYNEPYGNITIMKRDAETNNVIEGVEFRLLVEVIEAPGAEGDNDTTETGYITIDGKNYKIAKDINGNDVPVVATGANGVAEFVNIPYGDYFIQEVKANGSYKVLKDLAKITLNKDNDALKYASSGSEAIPEDSDEEFVPLKSYKLGDPTNDGIIDDNDLKIIAGIIDGTITGDKVTDYYKYASDVNLDGDINGNDKDLMVSYLGGNKAAFDGLREITFPGQYQKRVTIVVTNVPIDMKISKQDITNSKELKGAEIVIKNASGEVFITFVSTLKAKEFYIPVGEYTLIENAAPQGYENLKTEVKFSVDAEGNVKILSAKSNMYEIKASTDKNDTDIDHLVIYNNVKKIPVPDTGSVVTFVTIIVGISLLGVGGYSFYRKYNEVNV